MKTHNKFRTCDAIEFAIRNNLSDLLDKHSDILNTIENVRVLEFKSSITSQLTRRTTIKLIANGHNLDLHVYVAFNDDRPFFAWHLN